MFCCFLSRLPWVHTLWRGESWKDWERMKNWKRCMEQCRLGMTIINSRYRQSVWLYCNSAMITPTYTLLLVLPPAMELRLHSLCLMLSSYLCEKSILEKINEASTHQSKKSKHINNISSSAWNMALEASNIISFLSNVQVSIYLLLNGATKSWFDLKCL